MIAKLWLMLTDPKVPVDGYCFGGSFSIGLTGILLFPGQDGVLCGSETVRSSRNTTPLRIEINRSPSMGLNDLYSLLSAVSADA